jgi:magnesium chelatase ATPase subunit I
MRVVYPFTAIVGQEDMKLALVLNVIDPLIGGVLIMGHRGTGKSTAVRALAELLPEIPVVAECPYHCDPGDLANLCDECAKKVESGVKLRRVRTGVRVVDLPLGATEDRLCGTIDIERALNNGTRAFEPGLLARANRGFLYIDEVNLLDDHLVDVLLDVAVTGRNLVEREGISIEHPSRFVLVGSGNPEEGELRPQLLDRFGLHVKITTDNSLESRVAIIERLAAFEQDSDAFLQSVKSSQESLRKRVIRARNTFRSTRLERALIYRVAELCSELKVDGHRGELTITRAARALAAFDGKKRVIEEHVRRVAVMALAHRLHRDPLEDKADEERIQQALESVFNTEKNTPTLGKANDGSDDPRGHRHGGEGKTSANGAESAHTRGASPRSEKKKSPGVTSAIPSRKPDDALPGPCTSSSSHHTSSRTGNRSISPAHNRGRYMASGVFRGSKIAIDATVRAAATRRTQANVIQALSGRQIFREDLRYKLFSQKSGTLYILLIDASGSMAQNRIAHAKRVALGIFQRSYVDRDRVAIIAFAGTTAEILLRPSNSMARARRVLDALSVGGGTPL